MEIERLKKEIMNLGDDPPDYFILREAAREYLQILNVRYRLIDLEELPSLPDLEDVINQVLPGLL